MSMTWVLVTGEYPPDRGGVADYTHLLARQLVCAGDRVIVVTQASAASMAGVAGEDPAEDGIFVKRLLNGFWPSGLERLDRILNELTGPFRILIQYVPHAYGMRAMNLPFCRWASSRARRYEIWTMFHEVAFPMAAGQPLRHNLLGAINLLMAMLLGRASRRIFITTPAWSDILLPLIGRGRRMEWLGVPANVPDQVSGDEVKRVRVRRSLGLASTVIGHFGTYSPTVTADLLRKVLPKLLERPGRYALLCGRSGDRFAQELSALHPRTADRIRATGGLPPAEVSAHLTACDFVVQPYADGVTTRRGTIMAGLSLGVPIVTNLGALSEPIWADSDAVALAERPDALQLVEAAERLAADPELREKLKARSRTLYLDRFSIGHTVALLREGSPPVDTRDG